MRCRRVTRSLVLGVSVGVGMVLSGCAEDADDFAAMEPDTCTFTYRNSIVDGGTEIDVWYIFLFRSGSDEIGDDLLGSSVLPYGDGFELTDVPLGSYDTIVVDEDSFYYLEAEVECDGEDWTWVITAEDADGQLEE